MANPTLPDMQTLLATGLHPDQKRPLIYSPAKEALVKQLRIMDEQQFLTRYKWYNLPHGLNENLIERILYYRGRAMFFYMEEEDKFYFLPFTFSKTIDVYGRWKECIPLPFTGSSVTDDKAKGILSLNVREPVYDFQMENMTWKDFVGKCVICYDYSQQLSQTILPRQQLNEQVIQYEADMLPYLHTSLLNATGVSGMRVNSTDEQASVLQASLASENASLNGNKWIPLIGRVDFQDLGQTSPANSQEFLLAMQSLDNFRQMTMGLGDGTLFQTRSHMLQTQADMAIGRTDGIYQDGLNRRQEFCNLVNSVFGIGIWCDASEVATGYDRDMNGLMADENTPAQQTSEGGDSGGSVDSE